MGQCRVLGAINRTWCYQGDEEKSSYFPNKQIFDLFIILIYPSIDRWRQIIVQLIHHASHFSEQTIAAVYATRNIWIDINH